MSRGPQDDDQQDFGVRGKIELRRDRDEAEGTRRDLESPLHVKTTSNRTPLIVGGLLIVLLAWLLWTISV